MAAHLSSLDYFVQKHFNSDSQERKETGKKKTSRANQNGCINVMFDLNLML